MYGHYDHQQVYLNLDMFLFNQSQNEGLAMPMDHYALRNPFKMKLTSNSLIIILI